MNNIQNKFYGCLLAGAIGDALGYTVEFMSLNEIKRRYGSQGITELEIDRKSNKAIVSDDTQMTLFTADGLIWAYVRCMERGIGSYSVSGAYPSYLRWYYTQTGRIPQKFFLKKQPHEYENRFIKYDKNIMEYEELFKQRAPGNTCLSALGSGIMGTIKEPINNSKGCGGVMRVAPVGLLLHKDPTEAFEIGADLAAITHGHPTGYLASGAFATIIAELINGKSIIQSTMTALEILKDYEDHDETTLAIRQAIELSKSDKDSLEAIKEIGEGWIAEEALAIALYCALKEKEIKKALVLSVNHDGDSDSTGSICGNILGALNGVEAIPKEYLEKVELDDLIYDLSSKLYQLAEKVY